MGGEAPGVLRRATLYHDGRRALGFELDVGFEYSVYERLLDSAAFALSAENRGPIFGGELRTNEPVDITVFLRHDLLPSWFSEFSAFESEAGALVQALASPEHALAHTDAWVFVSVTQEVPEHAFRVGYKHSAYQDVDAHLLR